MQRTASASEGAVLRARPEYALPAGSRAAGDPAAFAYNANRLGNTASLDNTYILAAARDLGAGSVQLTASPDFNGGWAFELAWFGYATPYNGNPSTLTISALVAGSSAATGRDAILDAMSVRDPRFERHAKGGGESCQYPINRAWAIDPASDHATACTFCAQVTASAPCDTGCFPEPALPLRVPGCLCKDP